MVECMLIGQTIGALEVGDFIQRMEAGRSRRGERQGA